MLELALLISILCLGGIVTLLAIWVVIAYKIFVEN